MLRISRSRCSSNESMLNKTSKLVYLAYFHFPLLIREKNEAVRIDSLISFYQIPKFNTTANKRKAATLYFVILTSTLSIERPLFLPQ